MPISSDLTFHIVAGRENSSVVATPFRSVKYFSANCILPSLSMLPSVLPVLAISLASDCSLMVMLPTMTVEFLSYSTMVAFRVLKAYRQASSRFTALTPLKSPTRSSARPIFRARLATLTDQLGPV